MNLTDRIYVAGHHTLLGKALLRQLQERDYSAVIASSAEEPDLTDRAAVEAYFNDVRPDYVFLAAGMTGGIGANQKIPAELMLDNLLIQCQVIHSAQKYRTRKLVYFASSCSYPRSCRQPMQVASLMTGPLEPTNEAYATAKIAGIKLCQAYRQQYGVDMISVIPANMFGPGDEFGVEDSHVIAALIIKMHRAKHSGTEKIDVWGSGSPRREFIYVDDVADAAIFLMENYSSEIPINVGNGADVSIREIAQMIKEVVGYNGELCFDQNRPDGMPLKALDSSDLLAMGWQPKTPLRLGLARTYRWFVETNGGDA
ncbi:MAG: GDP-L-fucose synthase [Candidatus Binatia bacterium]